MTSDSNCHLTQTFQNDQHCLIMCQALSKNFAALLDTGSPRSLMQSSLFSKINSAKIPLHMNISDAPNHLLNASNQKMTVLGTAIIPIKIAGLLFNQEF